MSKFIREDNAQRTYNMLLNRIHRKFTNIYLFSGLSRVQSDTIRKVQTDINHILDVLNEIAQEVFAGEISWYTRLKLYQEPNGAFTYEIVDFNTELEIEEE